MLFRVLTVLICLVVFINGCNSVVSQHFGTHKLRHFTIDQALTKGIGDSDFIELSGATPSGDFVYVPGKRANNPGIIIFPLLSEEQLAQLDQGRQVRPRVIAWTEDFNADCVKQGNCVPRGVSTFKGVIRNLSKEKNKTGQLPADKYALPEYVIYMETNREPIAWYWNVAMMAGSVLLAFIVERRNFFKPRTPAS